MKIKEWAYGTGPIRTAPASADTKTLAEERPLKRLRKARKEGLVMGIIKPFRRFTPVRFALAVASGATLVGFTIDSLAWPQTRGLLYSLGVTGVYAFLSLLCLACIFLYAFVAGVRKSKELEQAYNDDLEWRMWMKTETPLAQVKANADLRDVLQQYVDKGLSEAAKVFNSFAQKQASLMNELGKVGLPGSCDEAIKKYTFITEELRRVEKLLAEFKARFWLYHRICSQAGFEVHPKTGYYLKSRPTAKVPE